MPTSSTARGRAAESIAAGYLELAGYSVLGRNLRFGALEVDVLARRGNVLVVVEVRYRRRPVGPPQDIIPPEKWRRLMRAAALAAEAHANEHPGPQAEVPAESSAHASVVRLRLQVDLILVEGAPGGLQLRHIRKLPPHRPFN